MMPRTDDRTASPAAPPQHADLAGTLRALQARLNAIVANTPGLVYQFVLRPDGRIAFPYLSDGCKALLGLSAAQLRQQPARFLELILAEDRPSYLDAMRASADALRGWNWEGRIWIAAWQDVKWINLRATPHGLADGGVQWEGIMSNITDSKLEQQEVLRSRARLAELTAHIDKVKEQERSRIAREIHDDLGGNLSAIKMALAMLARRLPAEDSALHAKADYLDALVDRSIDAVHRIALDLRPPMLDLGIVAALEWQVGEFEKQTGLECSFATSAPEIALDLDQATALFRIFQEALTNIAKHAGARRVTVRLACGQGRLRLEVADDGVGLAPADRLKPTSFGIRSMVERAGALGGSVQLHGGAGGGTVVAITIAVAAPNPPADLSPAGDNHRHHP